MLCFVGVESIPLPVEDHCKKYEIDFTYAQVKPARPLKTWISIFRFFLRMQPHIIVLHGHYGVIPALLFRFVKRRTAVVAVDHQAHNLKKLRERIVFAFAMYFLQKVVFLTKFAQRSFLSSKFSSFVERRSCVIPNGVAVSGVGKDRGDDVVDGGPVIRIGMAGRFVSTKRQDVLIRSFSRLRREFSRESFVLHFAGTGPTLEASMSLAKSLGVSDSVRFDGHVAQDEMCSWYRELDLYVHATDGETLSMAVLQAFSLGIPVLVSRTPGMAETVQGVNGPVATLVNSNSCPDWFNALAEFVLSPSSFRDKSVYAYDLVSDCYSITSMRLSYNLLFDEISPTCTRATTPTASP